MLPLGKVCEQPLLSLIRICENGKLRCAIGAEFYFPSCPSCPFCPFCPWVSFLIPKTSEGTHLFSRVAFLLPVPSDHSFPTLGEEFSNFHFQFLRKEGLEVGTEQGGLCNECTQFRQADGIIGVWDVEFQVATVVILLV